jgi:hypothetical protein
MLEEEGQRQENIKNITVKAISKLDVASKPEELEKDWVSYFFSKSRLTSDEEMQSLWASILAGQVNRPASFSKRLSDRI